jgi:hypothetical protein
MTLLEQALRILGDEARNNKATVRGIKIVRNHVERLKEWRTSGLYGTRTKDQKKAAQQVAAALRKLKGSLKRCASILVGGFPLDDYDFEKWIKRADEAGTAEIPKQNPKDQASLYAARAALAFLRDYRLPTPLTNKGRWCRLAAILYGEPDAHFLHHCRRVADLDRAANRPG